jgi:hypothetical protein
VNIKNLSSYVPGLLDFFIIDPNYNFDVFPTKHYHIDKILKKSEQKVFNIRIIILIIFFLLVSKT